MPVNTPPSNSTHKGGNTPKIPGMFRTMAQLAEQGQLSAPALRSYLLNRSPIVLLAVVGVSLFIHIGLWQPLRKAAFSWREDLPFDYGDIALHSALCLFLLSAFMVGAIRLYRRESRLLRLFNYGEVTQHFTFSDDRREYTYVDPNGVSHMRHFAQDHAGLTFGNSTLNTGVQAPQRIWAPPDAEKCAQSIAGQPDSGYVLFLPERPDIFHMVIGKGMDSYRLRKPTT